MLSRSLLALTIASFGIGTTEFIIMGLLLEVAESLNVTVPRANDIRSVGALHTRSESGSEIRVPS